MNDVPSDGLLLLSDAVNRLAGGMWGGLRRPVGVRAIKQTFYKASVGFGPRRQRAGQRLRTAAVAGELVVYLVATPQAPSKNRAPAEHSAASIEPVVVPVEVLKKLLISRGSLPDRPFRPSLKAAGGNEKLFVLLTAGVLVVRESDFDHWYRAERAKGKWASQRSKSNSPIGRPTRQTEALRNAVLARVHDGEWNGNDSIMALHRLLVAFGISDVPSPDTLARLVDQLFSETGEPGLRRTACARRQRARAR